MPYVTIGLAAAALVAAVTAVILALQAKQLADPDRLAELEKVVHEKSERDVIQQMKQELRDLQDDAETLDTTLDKTGRRLDTAIQKIGLARFNSSEQVGGELSFSLTMLDARNHGFILTSQTDLENTRLFIRGIVSGKSRNELLDHEENSLQQALESK